eukprot:scaffold67649_cov21-Tisochrysis_lutea.AAC.1
MLDLVRYLVARYGSIDRLVLTNDFFWLTRGRNSSNGSGTMCDLDSGAVLAFRHYCIGTDSQSNRGGFEFTPKSMDAIGCGEMLDELVDWFENGPLDELIDRYNLDIRPSLDGVVLDGDASTLTNPTCHGEGERDNWPNQLLLGPPHLRLHQPPWQERRCQGV